MLDENTPDQEIIDAIVAEAEAGNLIDLKHDPDALTATAEDRTVASHETKQHITEALKADDEFEWDLYRNSNPKHSPFYLVLTPTSNCRINIAASGVVTHTPVNVKDRLVVVDSQRKGKPLWGEDSNNIAQDVNLQHVRRLQRTKQGRGK